ncbi:cupredoxin domain-containing protein [Halorussus sp. AFM4]|uniref:cupredoxin domain-containing protein n=1 Tax=Halorussus sp. AFM4 TaxID=3421651 RepID=UPI003EBBD014
MAQDDSSEKTRRRDVLKVAGVTGALASFGTLAGAQDQTTTAGSETTTGGETGGQETNTATGDAQPIILGGEVDGWYGLVPNAIEGEENPTLTLTSGTTYELTWINMDGAEHELLILDADGNIITATESATKPGATRTMTFTASQKMARYKCEYHPKRMRGEILLV